MARDRLRPGLRTFPARGHLIFYIIADDGIEIVRVLHEARDVDALFWLPSTFSGQGLYPPNKGEMLTAGSASARD